MPVKVKQINEYLFSDTVQSQKTKSGSDEISQGQYPGYPSKVSMRLIVKESTSLRAYHSEALESRSTRRGVVDLVVVTVCQTGSCESIAPNCTRSVIYGGKRAKCQFEAVMSF